MNAYVAERFAAERIAEFVRDAETARLVRDARRHVGTHRTRAVVRVPAVVAAASLIVTLWLGVPA